MANPVNFNYADDNLWSYLRSGLSQLETGTLDPSTVKPGFTHADKTKGAYGFSENAYKDVQKAYPSYFKGLTYQDVTSDPSHYELASRAYADLMLKHLQNHIHGLTYPQTFNEFQKIWNTGATGYDKGKPTAKGRQKNADKYIEENP
jgi:hypothetical protein